MGKILCEVSLPLQSDVLLAPVFTSRPIFEKFKEIPVYSPFTAGEIIISHTYSIPVHVPEAGCTISLDIRSEGLAQEFMELTHEFRKGRKRKIVVARLYNFNSAANRAVTRGKFTAHEIDESVYRIHMANLLNDLMFLPSIIAENALWSPLRWFPLESTGEYWYRTIYTYNVFIVYLDDESVKSCKKIRLWLGGPVDVFSVRGGLIELENTGNVKIRKIYLCFLDEPSEILPRNIRGYYMCFSESFNCYTTNYHEFRHRNFNINLVDVLSPLIHSPYDIVPFLSPYFTDLQNHSFLIRFAVPVNVIEMIIKRFEKFGGIQSRDMVENYNRLFERINGLVRIREIENHVLVTLVNPLVIAYIIRMHRSENRLARRCARKILNGEGSHILDRVLFAGENFRNDFDLIVSLAGYGRYLETRLRNTGNYLKSFREVSGVSTRS